MRLEVGDFGIDVVELGATGRIDTTADGLVVHARAGGTVFWTSTANGFEEWLLVEPAAVQAERVVVAQWKVSGAQLRPMGETVAVLDLRGVRRMVVSAPEAFSDGRKVPAWLEADGDTLSISVASADVRGRVLVDPLWTVVGMMSSLRVLAQSTLLPGGKVLMTGGQGMPPEVEVFDPFTQTWALTTPLNRGRHCHTAVGLQDGRVLVLGGIAALASGGGQYSPTTELYNPVSATWSAGAPMLASRCFATATLLSNGTVLVAGGRQGSGPLAELYDPTTNTWSPTGPMQDDRFQHTATLLPDGRVLAVTGTTPQSAAGGTDTTELYDPATNSWRDAGVLIQSRTNHTASLVQGGKVVVAGGWIYWGNGFLTSVEIYDSDAGTWSPGPPTAEAHVESPWVSLGSGEPLVIGGYASEATESYEPATNSWSSRGKLATPHSQGTATLLLDGRVLVAGGYDLKSEVFDPTLGRTCSTGASCISGLCVDGFCCDSACGGACDRCDLPGLAGVCTPIDAGTIGTSSCAPYACNGESGACPTACTDDLHCAPTHFCLNGGCVPNGTGPQAALCRKAAQCASGFCADGRCCNEACTASCTSCDLPGSEGVCGHALPNTKDTTCTAFKCNPADAGCLTVCGSAADCQAGFFCADGGCEVLRPLGAGCVQAGDCADNHCTQGTCCQNDCPFPCGACVGPGFSCGPAPLGFDGGLGCAPFECDGTQLFCPSSCTSDAGCVPGRFCSGGHACLLPGEGATGIACTSHFQCATGACIDGFCCDTECGGEDRNDCQACSVARGATANGTCMLLSSATTCGPGRLPDGGLWGCDVHEYCTGVSPTCPTDLFADAGTLCHAPAGACDEPEYCVGNWPHCPDQHPRKPPGFVCRASTGACDPAEKCNGLEAECPVDGFAATTEVCRPAASACDAEELCSGSSAACPPDLSRANGEACGTALACTNGVCSSIPDAGVDGGAGGSGGAGGGTGGSGGSGGGSGGTGGSAGGSALVDAGASDGGSTDAGPGGGGTSGCGCSTAPETMLTWIAVVALVRRRRYGAAP